MECRYEKGHHFGKHIDESNRVGKRETRYTLLIYLSGGPPSQSCTGTGSAATAPLKGGETLFYSEPFADHQVQGGRTCTLGQL